MGGWIKRGNFSGQSALFQTLLSFPKPLGRDDWLMGFGEGNEHFFSW